LNFHPSYLPFNRGKAPNYWCLVNETPCGVSLHYLDEGIDSGPIVAQRKIPTTWEDTGESVYYKCRDAIIELFKDSIDAILTDALPKIDQNLEEGCYHNMKKLEESSNIDLDGTYTARELFNILRARTFPPHPSAIFSENGKKYSVTIKIEEIKNG
jgi:methionyl-tRNA formyltransferase